MNEYPLKFIRYGLGLSITGLVVGYFPLAHYLMSGSTPSCPGAPIHGRLILLRLFGMGIFGLLYKALHDWMEVCLEAPIKLSAHG